MFIIFYFFPNLSRHIHRYSGNKNKTFRPVKNHTDPKRKQMSNQIQGDFAKATLGTGDLATAVRMLKFVEYRTNVIINPHLIVLIIISFYLILNF